MLLVEYNVVTEVTNIEDEFSAEEMDEHKPVYYYVMNNGCVEEHTLVFEKSDIGMKSHLKPFFIKAKVDNHGVNKVLVDIGASVNLIPHSLLTNIEKFDNDLKPHTIILSNYEGNTGHFLGAI